MSTQKLANRLEGVSESATLKLNAAVQALKAQGVHVVNMAAGEPDFPVHEVAKQAVIDAVKANLSRYTPATGNVDLRAAICRKTNAQQPTATSEAHGGAWKPADVVVTNGGKQALFNLMLAVVNPGDEVLIPAPYWLSYPEMAKVAGGVPRFIETTIEQGFRVSPDQLKRALTPKTRVLVLNSPSNPTGSVYSKEEFKQLAAVLAGYPNVIVVSDEIYDRIILGNTPFTSFLEAAPELRSRVVTVNGMSKSAAMTGWRIGWSVAPQWITQGLSTLQGQSTSGINALAQAASLAALALPDEVFDKNQAVYRRRRDLALSILGKSKKLKVFAPGGAFYLFVGVGECLRPGEDSLGFCERLLEAAKVAAVPGTPFGAPDYLRMSFATDEKSIEEACTRLVEFTQR
jgi:aspartate aminotransferase